MDPHINNDSQQQQTTTSAATPPPQNAPPITGSQLEDQASAANWEQSKKKLKLGILIGGGVLLLGAAYIIFALLTTKPNTEPLPAVNNTPPPSQPQPTASQQPKYTETDYANGHGYTFRLKYFTGAHTIGHCEVQVFKPRCIPAPPTNYLTGSKQGRPNLLFSIQPASSEAGVCQKTTFTFTLNNVETPMCQEDLGGKTLQYIFAFTVKGEKLMGVFTMDNPAAGQFIDASQYEDDLKEIASSIKLYL
jgi:hypothetical protein